MGLFLQEVQGVDILFGLNSIDYPIFLPSFTCGAPVLKLWGIILQLPLIPDPLRTGMVTLTPDRAPSMDQIVY